MGIANEDNVGVSSGDGSRKEFLLHMYDQMMNDINRHILVVWQSVGVLVGALAGVALVGKGVVSLDVGAALIVLTSGWLVAHVYDASYWYNRNLVIVANIERQFLRREDLRRIHYYFGRHRRRGAMLTHLRIQQVFGVLVALVVLGYHLLSRFAPTVENSSQGAATPAAAERWVAPALGWLSYLPYAVFLVCLVLLVFLRSRSNKKYQEFLKNSPGISVDTTGLDYGVGHPSEP